MAQDKPSYTLTLTPADLRKVRAARRVIDRIKAQQQRRRKKAAPRKRKRQQSALLLVAEFSGKQVRVAAPVNIVATSERWAKATPRLALS